MYLFLGHKFCLSFTCNMYVICTTYYKTKKKLKTLEDLQIIAEFSFITNSTLMPFIHCVMITLI